jgi:tetratricopeptide (TPR) repeat protein
VFAERRMPNALGPAKFATVGRVRGAAAGRVLAMSVARRFALFSDGPPPPADASPAPVELAHEPAFHLGRLEVTPSLGQVAWNGDRQTLQPRVMQVLVALARHRGQVVSRDRLVELCWEGRTVGDDALHRCIAVLRRLGGRSGAFALDTLPRIGHRLRVTEPGARAPRLRGAVLLAATGLMLVALALGAWWVTRPTALTPALRVEVAPFDHAGPAGQGRALATSFSDELAGILNESGVQTTSASRGLFGRPAGDLRLRGAFTPAGGRVRLRVFLDQPASGVTLWSADFESQAAEIDRLRDEVAAATIETIATALEPASQRGLRLDAETLALHIRGSDIVRSPQLLREGEPRRVYEQVVRRAPGFAAGHGVLAVALANEARRAPASAAGDLRRRSEAAARRAIAIDPASAGAAYDALYMLQRQRAPHDYAAAERVLLEGLKAAPEFPFLNMRRCRFLLEVGRAAEGLPPCQRALALRPMAGPIGYTHARALQANGDLALAEQAMERAIRYNPDHGSTRQTRFELAAFEGSAARAAALLDGPGTTPQFIAPEGAPALRAFLAARRSGRPSQAAAAVSALGDAVEAGRLSSSLAVRAVTVLGDTEAAFALLQHPRFQQEVDSAANASVLLEPPLRPLRADPRFWQAAARAGLAGYWASSGRWPDFCGAQIPPAECRRLADAALRTVARPERPPAGAAATVAQTRQLRTNVR